jgi:WD40 repeat protein
MKTQVLNGYDGFGGVHDNLVWNQVEGWMAYTLHNKVIFETVKTREQTVLVEGTAQLSTMALSQDKRLLAVGEGRGRNGNALIYLFDTASRTLVGKFTFHQKGVQSLAFSNNGSFLISAGVQGENNLAIWDLSTGLVVRSCLVKNTTAVNAVRVDPFLGVGSAGADPAD